MNEIHTDRPHQSRTWRNLVVLLSMDAPAGLHDEVRLPPSAPAHGLQKAFRDSVVASAFDPERGWDLWAASINRLEGTLGPSVAATVDEWGHDFPSDPDSVRPGLCAWERLWPELANRLTSASAASPWGPVLAQAYRRTARDSTLEAKLAERLQTPLTDWDKRCFVAYASEDLLSELDFFSTLVIGSQRLALADFWAKAASTLDPATVDVVWQLARDLWREEHAPMSEADLAVMRAEIGNDDTYYEALNVLRRGALEPPTLPHPDLLVEYSERFRAFG